MDREPQIVGLAADDEIERINGCAIQETIGISHGRIRILHDILPIASVR